MNGKPGATLQVWQFVVGLALTALGGALTAGFAWASVTNDVAQLRKEFDARVEWGNEKVKLLERIDKKLQRIGDKLEISFEDIE